MRYRDFSDRHLPVEAGDPYNYRGPADAAANKFLALAAKLAGMSLSGWMAANGMVGAALEARIKKHERPESTVPAVLLEAVDSKLSAQSYSGALPGGAAVPSIIDNGRVVFQKDMPKRRRGRPSKRLTAAQRGDQDGD